MFLGPNGEVEEYAIIPIQPNAAISSELTLDQSEEHLYIMTSTMVTFQNSKIDFNSMMLLWTCWTWAAENKQLFEYQIDVYI